MVIPRASPTRQHVSPLAVHYLLGLVPPEGSRSRGIPPCSLTLLRRLGVAGFPSGLQAVTEFTGSFFGSSALGAAPVACGNRSVDFGPPGSGRGVFLFARLSPLCPRRTIGRPANRPPHPCRCRLLSCIVLQRNGTHLPAFHFGLLVLLSREEFLEEQGFLLDVLRRRRRGLLGHPHRGAGPCFGSAEFV